MFAKDSIFFLLFLKICYKPELNKFLLQLRKGKTQLPLFQAIPGRQKLTSFIPSHQAKTNFFNSNPFQSGQNRLLQFQSILVGHILKINPLASPCFVAPGHQTIQFLLVIASANTLTKLSHF
jgi:hypothetical protein